MAGTPKPDWTKDPDRILQVALEHCLWDVAFAGRLVDRIALWATENPRHRDRLRELLKAPKAGRQSLQPVEYARALAEYNDLKKRQSLKADDAVLQLAATFKTSTDNIERRLKQARKMLKAGDLDEWKSILK